MGECFVVTRCLFFDDFIIFFIADNPNIIFTPINRNFFAFAINHAFVSVPINFISAMSAFIVNLLFR